MDDALTPLTQGDALELFASRVVEDTNNGDPELAKKFDPYWFRVIIDLAGQVVQKCTEKDVAATLDAVQRERSRSFLSFRERALRRKLSRNLPEDAKTRLTALERDSLVGQMIQSAISAQQDQEMWDACWGRLAGWSPVVQAAESPAEEPPADAQGVASQDFEPVSGPEETIPVPEPAPVG